MTSHMPWPQGFREHGSNHSDRFYIQKMMDTNFQMDKVKLNSIHLNIDNNMVELDFVLFYKFPNHNLQIDKFLYKIFLYKILFFVFHYLHYQQNVWKSKGKKWWSFSFALTILTDECKENAFNKKLTFRSSFFFLPLEFRDIHNDTFWWHHLIIEVIWSHLTCLLIK